MSVCDNSHKSIFSQKTFLLIIFLYATLLLVIKFLRRPYFNVNEETSLLISCLDLFSLQIINDNRHSMHKRNWNILTSLIMIFILIPCFLTLVSCYDNNKENNLFDEGPAATLALDEIDPGELNIVLVGRFRCVFYTNLFPTSPNGRLCFVITTTTKVSPALPSQNLEKHEVSSTR